MPLPDPNYVAMFPLQEYFVDKDTGAPLAAGTLSFYVDETNRTVPKDVYIQQQQPDNTYLFLNIGSVITLSSVGTPQYLGVDFIPFMWPYDGVPGNSNGDIELYEVVVESSGGVLQFTREAWPPNVESNVNPTDLFEGSENAISNPQFVKVLFTPDIGATTYTLSVPGALTETEIAPGWSIITSGTGSGTVTLQQLDISDSNIISNPSYALSIQSSGSITSIILQQKFDETPRLFSSGFINGSVVASSTGGVARSLILNYAQSNGSIWEIVNGSTTADNLYSTIEGTIDIVAPPTISTDAAPTGYSYFYVVLPVGELINITSVQLVSVQNASSSTEFLQETVGRQVDHLFHYYKPQLDYKPVPSLLVGWDFPLNPRQFGNTAVLTATPAYALDQTIMARVTNNVNVSINNATGGLTATTTGNTESFYCMQYLSDGQARKILGTKLSVNVSAYKTATGSDVTCRVYLFRGSSSAVFPTLGNTIGSLASSGVFTKNNTAGQGQNWTEISRDSLGVAHGTISVVTTNSDLNDIVDLSFSGWEITDSTEIGDTDKFCIVVTFAVPTTGSIITINSIGLTPGDIATRPAPQTVDEVFEECQYYYEKTGNMVFQQLINPNEDSGANVPHNLIGRIFGFNYKNYKRTNPTITTLSSNNNALNTVYGEIYNGAIVDTAANINISNWTETGKTFKSVLYQAANVNNLLTTGAFIGNFPEAWIKFYAIIDARLGVV